MKNIPFRTTKSQFIKAKAFKEEMVSSGVEELFANQVLSLAKFDQGIYDLMELWIDSDSKERLQILSDMKSVTNDYLNFQQA